MLSIIGIINMTTAAIVLFTQVTMHQQKFNEEKYAFSYKNIIL